jgi:predicted transcriptional regulator
MSKSKISDPNIQVLAELDAIKRLLTLLLMKAGASQDELSAALKVDRSTVSRMLPTRKVKNFRFIN